MFSFIHGKKKIFKEFLKKSYPIPIPDSNVNKEHCNYIIKFERLNEDFSNLLKMLNIYQIRPLPHLNITQYKENYVKYYEKDIIEYAQKIFGPFMLERNDIFPNECPTYKDSIFT